MPEEHGPKLNVEPELTVAELQLQIVKLEEENLELKKQIDTDPLTKLNNQRGFEKATTPLLKSIPSRRRSTEQGRRQEFKRVACILILDLDNFKIINDTYGHPRGDQVLEQVSKFLRDITREGRDVLWRYRGDEFVVLFSGLTARDVMQRFKNQDTNKTELGFEAILSLPGEERKISITFSGGVADYQSGESYEKTLDRADNALLQAKQAGRCRIYKARPARPRSPG